MSMTNFIDPDDEISAFFELTPDLACIASKEGYFKKINPAVKNKLGYTEEELLSQPISSFIHPEDRELTGKERNKLLNGEILLNLQNRYVCKSGKVIWLQWTSIYYPEREVVFAIAKDVTEKKRVEKEIEEKYKKFKSLATYFKSSIEENRKYLAVELHEELAQLACVVKMDIDWINSNQTDLSADAKKRIDHALGVTDLLIKTIRRISFSISPNMLDDIGLNASLEWYCKEFSILNGIPCSFETNYSENCLNREIKLDFFRICQESLVSIKDSAQAQNVKIIIEDVGKNIRLSIVDEKAACKFSEGNHKDSLTAIKERVASINGVLRVENKKGTKIFVEIQKP